MKTNKFYFTAVVICYLFMNASCVCAQKKEIPKKLESESEIKAKAEQRKIATENLIFNAQGQQGEIAADALIRVVETNKIISTQRKVELLEEAFRRASDTQHPVRLGYAGPIETRSGMLSEALDLELDKLSLQSRVAKAMLVLDKKRAREMFNEIPPKLSLTPVGCKEGFIFHNVDKFYETLSVVLANGFTEKEKKQNAHIFYALPYIEGITSPAQVVPIIKTILSLRPNQIQLSILAGSFTRSLKNVVSDDHSFRQSMSSNKTASQIINLRKAYNDRQLPDQELLDVFRAYLLKQLSGTRCSDGLKLNNESPLASKYSLPNYVEFVNANLLTGKPITAEQIEPFKIENAERSPEYNPDSGEENRLEKYRKLRFPNQDKEVSEIEIEQDEWQVGFSQLLNDVVAWTPNNILAEQDYFHQKCAFFQLLLEIAPKDKLELRVNAFNQYLSFVSNSPMQRENRAEWLMQAQRLLSLIIAARGEEKIKMQRALEDTNNTTLVLYLKLKTSNETAAEQINGREGETAILLSRRLFNLNGLGGGFAPYHLKR